MKIVSDGLKAHMQGEVTSLCTCLEIVRPDGRGFYFTDHDEPVVVGTTRYVPYNSFSRTSVLTTMELEVDSMEIHGILNSTAVPRDDINGGLFDYSVVHMFLVNWADPSMGRLNLRRGWIGEIAMEEDGTFNAEVRGLSQVYTYRVGEVYAPECRADLGDKRCQFPIAPPRWFSKQLYRVGDYALGTLVAPTNYATIAYVNAGFEDDTLNTVAKNLTGWTFYGETYSRWTVVADTTGVNSNYKLGDPHEGTQYLVQTSVSSTDPSTQAAGPHEAGLYQDVVLATHGVNLTEVDTGQCRLVFSYWTASVTSGSTGRVRVYCLDANGATLATIFDSGNKGYSKDRWIKEGSDNRLIPANTRTIRIDINAWKPASQQFGMAFDDFQAVVNSPAGTYAGGPSLVGRLFKCTAAGTSGATEPAWTTTIGAAYTDGTVTWVCTDTVIDFYEVTAVTNNQTFAVTSTRADGWFDAGLLTWETGKNAGRSMEVRSFASETFTTFERTFYTPQVGDRIVVRPGCDKLLTTCHSKFDNVLNFQGEPHVPGQDEFYRTPNADSSQ